MTIRTLVLSFAATTALVAGSAFAIDLNTDTGVNVNTGNTGINTGVNAGVNTGVNTNTTGEGRVTSGNTINNTANGAADSVVDSTTRTGAAVSGASAGARAHVAGDVNAAKRNGPLKGVATGYNSNNKADGSVKVQTPAANQ